MKKHSARKQGRLAPLIAAALATQHTLPLDAAGPATAFHLPAASLDDALKLYAQQTGRQLLYPSALVAPFRARPLDGRMDADRALGRLLRGTDIAVRALGSATFVLSARPGAARSAPRPTRPPHVRPAPSAAAPDTAEDVPGDKDVVITGSNIRGEGHGTSPILVLDRTAIDRAGYGTLSEAVASLPQNFGGTANEATSLTGQDRTEPNVGIGRSANLRGLGSDATLTLVNGRRVAGSGGKGDFTDLSTIPTAAIRRVEILTDGASALYGSDAVGGVVNVILRDDLDGGETRVRLGTVTDGGLRDVIAAQTLGAQWKGGHVLITYEYQRRDALSADDRAFTRTADLRGSGGTDHRSYYANPGTLLSYKAAVGAYVPAFAIPAGQDGTQLTPSQFVAGGNFENQLAGTDLLPEQTRHSIFVTAVQDLGIVHLYAEGRYAHRAFRFRGVPSTALISVTRANPLFVSPTGEASDLIAYSFGQELGPIRTRGTVASWSAVGGATVDLGANWQLDSYFDHAREQTASHVRNIANTTLLGDAVAGISVAGYDPASLGFFNPFGAGRVNSPALLAFIGQGFSNERVGSGLTSVNFKLDGTLLHLPGGSLGIALGANYRHETLVRGGESLFSGTTPQPFAATDAGRSIAALFGELVVPVFGTGNARPAVRRLLLSIAIRYEHYGDFGSTTNPKLGLLYEPFAGLQLRASYGTSFRAPDLRETTDPLTVSPVQLPNAQGVLIPSILLSGGNSALSPERARSWNIGGQIAPKTMPGFNAQLNFFRTHFTDRIGQPAYTQLASVLRDPAFVPFVRFVSPATNTDDLAEIVRLLALAGPRAPAGVPPQVFSAIVEGRYINSATMVVRGVDFSASQRVDLGNDKATIGVSGSWLLDYARRISKAAPLENLVGTLGNPSDLRLRGSANYEHGAWSATASLNYVDGYTDRVNSPPGPVASWTTVDAQIQRTFGKAGANAQWIFALSGQNLFDRDPPFVNNLSGIGYDSANADALGRFVALQVTRRW